MNLKLTAAILVFIGSMVDATGRTWGVFDSTSVENNSTESAEGDFYDRDESQWWYNVSGRLVRAEVDFYNRGDANDYIEISNKPRWTEGILRAKVYISDPIVLVRISEGCTIFNATETLANVVETVKSFNDTIVTPTSTIYVQEVRRLTPAEEDLFKAVCPPGTGNNYYAEPASAAGEKSVKTFYLDQFLVINFLPPTLTV